MVKDTDFWYILESLKELAVWIYKSPIPEKDKESKIFSIFEDFRVVGKERYFSYKECTNTDEKGEVCFEVMNIEKKGENCFFVCPRCGHTVKAIRVYTYTLADD